MHRSDPAPPVRMVHLGVGAFFRSHEAWYTERANQTTEGDEWGIHAFTGRSSDVALALSAQDCLYTLIERGADSDSATVIHSVSRVSDGADFAAWSAAVADPRVAILSLTITEAGYLLDAAGRLDFSVAALSDDLDLLRSGSDHAPVSAPARIVAGLRARFRASGPPLAIMSCDNLPQNGRITREVVLGVAERVDGDLAAWITSTVSFVSTMVDRITPATTADDRLIAAALTGTDDLMPVVCEPFTEWVICGRFPAGRPRWENAGARFVDDIDPFERRKLWLLNAGHSLLAYVGLGHGEHTIDEAMAHHPDRELLEQLWREAAAVLPFGSAEIDELLAALRSRFANPRIRHQLTQIAVGGAQKLPPRILDVHRARRLAGLPPGPAGAAVIAAWALRIASETTPPDDSRTADLSNQLRVDRLNGADRAARVIRFLSPDLTGDLGLAAAVRSALATLSPTSESRPHS